MVRVNSRAITFLLTYFLLSACLCTQPGRSHRQKRGLVKMMMHIMWDPVRLIRYWYAYDVTKEIAKSWRKIIPTILFLPISQHMPLSYGLAKYVHPTVGLRDTPIHKTKSKHYNVPVGSYFQESSISSKPMAIPPELLHEILPSRYSYVPQKVTPQYYVSSKETESGSQYEHKNAPHFIVEHIPYEDKEKENQYSIAHYFVGEGNSREQGSAPNAEIIFPAQIDHNSDDNVKLFSSQRVRSNFKSRPSNTHSKAKQQHRIHFRLPQTGSHEYVAQEESGQETSHILHPGQEFHIVLHPIPVGDFDPESLRPPSDGQTIKFVPINPPVNGSFTSNNFPSPLLFKAVMQSSVGSIATNDEHTTDATLADDSTKLVGHNTSNENSTSEEKQSIFQGSSKSSVSWIQQDSNLSRRKDVKHKDLKSDGTVTRTSSMHKNSAQKRKFIKGYSKENNSKMPSYGLHRQNINMERLREDLKHGTPVLIPFNKDIYSSGSTSDVDNKAQIAHSQLKQNDRAAASSLPQALSTEAQNAAGLGMDYSIEHSGERNNSQRFVLFLKKRKHS